MQERRADQGEDPSRTRSSAVAKSRSRESAPAAAPASRLVLAVEESDAALSLRLEGEFDLAGVGPVENALDRLSSAPVPTRVVFDLRDLEFLDIAGLRAILRADARGRAEAFEVVVVRPRGLANRVFTLTRVGEQLSMVDEPEAG